MTTTDATVADGAEAELAARLRDDGVVVLPEPLDPTLVAELRHAFMALLDDYVGASDTNRGPLRHQMYVPFSPPFDNPALWADPTALRVVEQVLGPDFECTYYGSDTPYPGSDYQPIHQDGVPCSPSGIRALPRTVSP